MKPVNNFKGLPEQGQPLDSSQKIINHPLKSIQNEINEREEERILTLQKLYKKYSEPVTQEIEEDEEHLFKAYKLFCKLTDINETEGDSKTHLKDLSITCPLCKKSEYIPQDSDTDKQSKEFLTLRLWFINTNPDALYIPQIVNYLNNNRIQDNTAVQYVLEFIEKEEWKPTFFEKELLQAITTKREN